MVCGWRKVERDMIGCIQKIEKGMTIGQEDNNV
jgi:hypothetical protein